MSDWKVIHTTVYPHEAHMISSYLESEGIPCIINDELTAQIHSFYSNAIGGVKILIRMEDFEKAYDLLIRGAYIVQKEEPVQQIELIDETRRRLGMKLCPFCNSENISKNKQANILTLVVYFILGAMFPIFRSTYKCFDCGKEWKYKKY